MDAREDRRTTKESYKGIYQCRVAGRELDAHRHHFDYLKETQHTLDVCPAWTSQRRALRDVIKDDLSLPVEVKAIANSELRAEFYEAVVLYKEPVERAKELLLDLSSTVKDRVAGGRHMIAAFRSKEGQRVASSGEPNTILYFLKLKFN